MASRKTILLIIFSIFFQLNNLVKADENPSGNIQSKGYTIQGLVIDKSSREPIISAVISIWNNKFYTISDEYGKFQFTGIPAGTYRLKVNLLGFKEYLSYEFMLSPKGEFITVELEEESLRLNEITVRPQADPFKRPKESPLSQKNIGIQEIERNPGSNRDISKVINSLPGVANVTGSGERNDILVRGGSPAENKFYLEGIEIPTINHFSTQGSTGGVVGIIDANFVRDADFYTGSFPVNKANALSSVLDIRFKDGDPVKNRYKFTIGASEAGFSANGHISQNTSFLFSARMSYLQFLFKGLKLPFLPTFTDAQFKIKTRFDSKHELSFIGIGAIDNMSLNEETGGLERNEYILAFLPVIKQNVYTIGATYRYYRNNGYYNFVLSHSYLNNKNTKYLNNDESDPSNLTLLYNSTEQETKFRAERILNITDFRFIAGAGIDFPVYGNETMQKIFTNNPLTIYYNTTLSFTKYYLFASANYTSPNEKFSATGALRADAHYSGVISPRVSFSYKIDKNWNISASTGRYYQLPPYTALGYKDNQGNMVNKNLDYTGADHFVTGIEFKKGNNYQVTLEGFYKKYFNMLRSINDNIPLLGKSAVYGTAGNETAASDLKGRAYGVELSARIFVADKFNLIGSTTLFRSFFNSPVNNDLLSQSWDNRVLVTLSAGYKLPGNVFAGLKYRYTGGSPYTPYDVDKSSLKAAWDASGRAYNDYTRYNSLNLPSFSQLDIRVDKEFYGKSTSFKIYIDIQNALNNKYNNPDILMSTGTVANPSAPAAEQTYVMKYIKNTSGTILPTIGLSIEF